MLSRPADSILSQGVLPNFGFVIQSAQLGYRPKNPVVLNEVEREEVEAFLNAVDADDDVQNVYVGLAYS